MQLGEKSVYISLQIIVTHHKVKPRQELKQKLEAETKAEAMKERCLLVCSHAQVNLCYTAKWEPRDDTAYSELGPPTSIVTEETVHRNTHVIEIILQLQFFRNNHFREIHLSKMKSKIIVS